MQSALRLARHRAPIRRCLATAVSPSHVVGGSYSTSTTATTATKPKAAAIPLSNIEAIWTKLSDEEKDGVRAELEKLNEKSWKDLTMDEKKASYYVSFGPHGGRTPASKPGDGLKVFGGVLATLSFSVVLFFAIRATAPEAPRTINKEWQEASNQRALDQKMNPLLVRISSENYKARAS
ncbi:COX4, subunit IV of cytochrome c oxidase [Hymenopellis radicata]|nr:COX4, subunit IV of cytochrome c oxidase [Hymenopellis radicata]